MRKRKILVLFLVILMLLLTGCQYQREGTEKINFSVIEREETNKVNNQPPLRIAIASMTSTKQSIKYYDQLLEYLGEKSNRKVEIMQRKTYAEVNELIKAGNIDIAFLCTYSYITARDKYKMELLAAPKMADSVDYRSYIIVAKDSNFNKLKDLQGKTFAFTDPLSTTGYLYPMFLLSKFNETPDTFFKRNFFTYSHDNAIKAVNEKLVDAAAIDSLVYHYLKATEPELVDNIKIIEKSAAFGTPPIVVRSNMDSDFKKQLQNFFLELNSDPKGIEILSKLKIKKFDLPTESEYDSLRVLISSVKR